MGKMKPIITKNQKHSRKRVIRHRTSVLSKYVKVLRAINHSSNLGKVYIFHSALKINSQMWRSILVVSLFHSGWSIDVDHSILLAEGIKVLSRLQNSISNEDTTALTACYNILQKDNILRQYTEKSPICYRSLMRTKRYMHHQYTNDSKRLEVFQQDLCDFLYSHTPKTSLSNSIIERLAKQLSHQDYFMTAEILDNSLIQTQHFYRQKGIITHEEKGKLAECKAWKPIGIVARPSHPFNDSLRRFATLELQRLVNHEKVYTYRIIDSKVVIVLVANEERTNDSTLLAMKLNQHQSRLELMGDRSLTDNEVKLLAVALRGAIKNSQLVELLFTPPFNDSIDVRNNSPLKETNSKSSRPMNKEVFYFSPLSAATLWGKIYKNYPLLSSNDIEAICHMIAEKFENREWGAIKRIGERASQMIDSIILSFPLSVWNEADTSDTAKALCTKMLSYDDERDEVLYTSLPLEMQSDICKNIVTKRLFALHSAVPHLIRQKGTFQSSEWPHPFSVSASIPVSTISASGGGASVGRQDMAAVMNSQGFLLHYLLNQLVPVSFVFSLRANTYSHGLRMARIMQVGYEKGHSDIPKYIATHYPHHNVYTKYINETYNRNDKIEYLLCDILGCDKDNEYYSVAVNPSLVSLIKNSIYIYTLTLILVFDSMKLLCKNVLQHQLWSNWITYVRFSESSYQNAMKCVLRADNYNKIYQMIDFSIKRYLFPLIKHIDLVFQDASQLLTHQGEYGDLTLDDNPLSNNIRYSTPLFSPRKNDRHGSRLSSVLSTRMPYASILTNMNGNIVTPKTTVTTNSHLHKGIKNNNASSNGMHHHHMAESTLDILTNNRHRKTSSNDVHHPHAARSTLHKQSTMVPEPTNSKGSDGNRKASIEYNWRIHEGNRNGDSFRKGSDDIRKSSIECHRKGSVDCNRRSSNDYKICSGMGSGSGSHLGASGEGKGISKGMNGEHRVCGCGCKGDDLVMDQLNSAILDPVPTYPLTKFQLDDILLQAKDFLNIFDTLVHEKYVIVYFDDKSKTYHELQQRNPLSVKNSHNPVKIQIQEDVTVPYESISKSRSNYNGNTSTPIAGRNNPSLSPSRIPTTASTVSGATPTHFTFNTRPTSSNTTPTNNNNTSAMVRVNKNSEAYKFMESLASVYTANMASNFSQELDHISDAWEYIRVLPLERIHECLYNPETCTGHSSRQLRELSSSYEKNPVTNLQAFDIAIVKRAIAVVLGLMPASPWKDIPLTELHAYQQYETDPYNTNGANVACEDNVGGIGGRRGCESIGKGEWEKGSNGEGKDVENMPFTILRSPIIKQKQLGYLFADVFTITVSDSEFMTTSFFDCVPKVLDPFLMNSINGVKRGIFSSSNATKKLVTPSLTLLDGSSQKTHPNGENGKREDTDEGECSLELDDFLQTASFHKTSIQPTQLRMSKQKNGADNPPKVNVATDKRLNLLQESSKDSAKRETFQMINDSAESARGRSKYLKGESINAQTNTSLDNKVKDKGGRDQRSDKTRRDPEISNRSQNLLNPEAGNGGPPKRRSNRSATERPTNIIVPPVSSLKKKPVALSKSIYDHTSNERVNILISSVILHPGVVKHLHASLRTIRCAIQEGMKSIIGEFHRATSLCLVHAISNPYDSSITNCLYSYQSLSNVFPIIYLTSEIRLFISRVMHIITRMQTLILPWTVEKREYSAQLKRKKLDTRQPESYIEIPTEDIGFFDIRRFHPAPSHAIREHAAPMEVLFSPRKYNVNGNEPSALLQPIIALREESIMMQRRVSKNVKSNHSRSNSPIKPIRKSKSRYMNDSFSFDKTSMYLKQRDTLTIVLDMEPQMPSPRTRAHNKPQVNVSLYGGNISGYSNGGGVLGEGYGGMGEEEAVRALRMNDSRDRTMTTVNDLSEAKPKLKTNTAMQMVFSYIENMGLGNIDAFPLSNATDNNMDSVLSFFAYDLLALDSLKFVVTHFEALFIDWKELHLKIITMSEEKSRAVIKEHLEDNKRYDIPPNKTLAFLLAKAACWRAFSPDS